MLLILPRIGIFRLLARLKKKNETISQVVDIVEKKVVDFWVIMTDNSIQEVGDAGRRRQYVVNVTPKLYGVSLFRGVGVAPLIMATR